MGVPTFVEVLNGKGGCALSEWQKMLMKVHKYKVSPSMKRSMKEIYVMNIKTVINERRKEQLWKKEILGPYSHLLYF